MKSCKYRKYLVLLDNPTAIQRKHFFECVFCSGIGKRKAVAFGSNLLPRKLYPYVYFFA
jgi:hypothetical protein